MKIILVTGSGGLIGSESVAFFCDRGFTVVGIDNNMRRVFFGESASTDWNRDRLLETYGDQYIHHHEDIRDSQAINKIFQKYNSDIDLIIHTAAQPSHDWAVQDPNMDFTINANGTHILLESTRRHCPNGVFIFCSTNKVYGDSPNQLPLRENSTRWAIEDEHQFYQGIDESMNIDHCKHSLFGVSKLAADVMVQEYGRYFGLKTASFRGGCLTGPRHSGAELHGFLSYLMKCTMTNTPYNVFGYKGKQVRDNIHSHDLVMAFYKFYQAPRVGEVYNMGGSLFSNCSVLEAIKECEDIAGEKLDWSYVDQNRNGDHIWWISDVRKFQKHYPDWNLTYNVQDILREIYSQNESRWG